APASGAVPPATMIWTSWATNGSALDRVLEQQKGFAAVAPQIKIEVRNEPSGTEYYTKLKAQLAADTGPDVVRAASQDWEALAKNGALMDVTARIAKEAKNAPLQSIYPNSAPSAEYQGKTVRV